MDILTKQREDLFSVQIFGVISGFLRSALENRGQRYSLQAMSNLSAIVHDKSCDGLNATNASADFAERLLGNVADDDLWGKAALAGMRYHMARLQTEGRPVNDRLDQFQRAVTKAQAAQLRDDL